MLLNQKCHNLKFSLAESIKDNSGGVLNQQPLVITRDSAYNFSVLDSDKMKLALILAKRDVKKIQQANQAEVKVKVIETIKEASTSGKKSVRFRATGQKKRQPCVSSTNRLPGPQMPTKGRHRPAAVARGNSPPVRDDCGPPKTFRSAVETHQTRINPQTTQLSGGQQEGLERQMATCTARLDRLQSMLEHEHQNQQPQLTTTRAGQKNVAVLTRKLDELMQARLPRAEDLCGRGCIDSRRPDDDSDMKLQVMDRLQELEDEMETIRSRWRDTGYEDVHSCEYEEHSGDAAAAVFTRHRLPELVSGSSESQDDYRVVMAVDAGLVSRLDRDRLAMDDPLDPRASCRHAEWLADDLFDWMTTRSTHSIKVDEVVDDVIVEFERASQDLVSSVLRAELGQPQDEDF